MHTPPPGWEGVAATLAELRARHGEMADFFEQQWCELETLVNDLAHRTRALDVRERELSLLEKDIAARLELVEVYRRLAETRCQLARPDENYEDELLAAWTRIEELETEIASFLNRKADPEGVAPTGYQSGEVC